MRALSRPSKLWANFRLVLKANVASQLILLVAAPVLTRLYTPADFGVLALYTTIVAMIAAVATLRFDWLVPNTRTDRGAAALWLAGGLTLVAALAVVIVILSLPGAKTLFAGRYDALYTYRYFIPAGVAGLAVHQLFHGWYIRRSNLAPVSRTKVVQSISNVAASLVLGALALEAFGLTFAAVIGSWAGIAILLSHADGLLAALRGLSLSRVRRMARRWIGRAVVSALVAGLNTFSTNAMILFLALVYRSPELGLLAFTYRLIGAPIGMVAQALSQSFWAHSAELVRVRDYAGLRSEYLRMSALLSGLAAPICLACGGASFFVTVIFGEKWDGMGEILIMLLPMICGMVVVSPTNHLVILNKQALQLFADLLRLGLVGLAAVLAALADLRFAHAVLLVSCGSLAGHLALFGIQVDQHRRLVRRH